MYKATRGFTLVELLVVIVVIAILAAVTVTAYNGIQSRSHDAAIRSDFSAIAKKLEMYKIMHGVYPHFTEVSRSGSDGVEGSGTAIRSQLATLEMQLSTNSYNTSTANTNVLYLATTDGQHFALLGYAKGNPTYYITDQQLQPVVHPNDGPMNTRYPGGNPGNIGDGIGLPYNTSFYYIFVRGGGGYRVWG